MKDIRSGEEITVRYGPNYFSDGNKEAFVWLASRNGKTDGGSLTLKE